MDLQLLALRGLILLGTAALSGCGSKPDPPGDPPLEIGQRFVDEPAFRRDALERSLVTRDNGEARLQLRSYAVDGAWDALPEHEPIVRPVGTSTEARPVWSGEVEWTTDALLELGRTAFDEWPAQSQPLLADVIDRPALARAVGLWSDDRGRIGGVVIERYADGSERPALTCSSCHARVDPDGSLLRGPASQLDIGALFSDDGSGPSGAGLVDVTSDGVDNPVAIPDLRATRHQRRLHWSGSLHNGLDALAVRIETLLVTSSSETVRPPREVVFALALYIWSLGENTQRVESDAPGARIFEEQCAGCHAGPTGEGDAIDADVVGTDPAVARSPARGTGKYRVPSLHRVGSRTHLTHEGRVGGLDAWLDPDRLLEDPAHPFGLDLAIEDRTELIDYVKSL